MTTLRRPRPAGSSDLIAALTRENGAAAGRRHALRPLRLVVIGEPLAGDVSLVAGARGEVRELPTGQAERRLPSMLAALAPIVRADLVLLADDARGPVPWLAGHLKSSRRRVVVSARTGAHEAARHSYFTSIAEALIGIDRDGLFSYTDRAKLAAAGHAAIAH